MGMFSQLAAQQQAQPPQGIHPQILQMLMQNGWTPPQQQAQPQQGVIPSQIPQGQPSPVTNPIQAATPPATNQSVMPTPKQIQAAMAQQNQRISNGRINQQGGLAAAGTPLNSAGQMTLPWGSPNNNTQQAPTGTPNGQTSPGGMLGSYAQGFSALGQVVGMQGAQPNYAATSSANNNF